MTDTFAKVSPGQPVRIKADTFNAMVDAARDCRNRVSQQGRTPQPVGSHSTGLIRVKNYANVDRARFAAQTINGMAFDPTDSDQLDQFQTEPLPTVHAPSTGEGRLLAILQEPIAAHGIGMAVINGFSVAYVNVIATTDTCADVTDGVVDYLTSGTSGPFTILSPLTATGQQWVAGKIGGGAANAAFAVDLTQTGGSAGGPTAAATWTYTVATLAGATLGTAVSPVASPHRWRRPSIGYMTAATAGLAHVDNSGDLVLDWINEVADQEACVT